MAIENVTGTSNPAIDTSDERKAFDTGESDESKTEVEAEDSESALSEDSLGEDEDSLDESGEDEGITEGEDSGEESERTEPSNDSLIDQIRAKNPKLLKEIPELRKVIFREQQFTEVFPSIDEAKQAKEAAHIFRVIETDITSGNSKNLLSALEGQGKETVREFVANFIPSVQELDRTLYLEMIYPELKKALRFVAKSQDENISTSARNVHFAIFGDDKLNEEVGLKPGGKKDPKFEELSQREQEFERKRYESFANDVSEVAAKRTRREIMRGFEDADLSDLFKEAVTDKIFKLVNEAMAADRRHMGNINNLWNQARRSGFTTDKKDSVLNAYLSRAKVLIPKYRQQVLAEAKVSAKDKAQNLNQKKPIRISSSNTSNPKTFGQKITGKQVDWSKADERAMLDGNIPLKGR